MTPVANVLKQTEIICATSDYAVLNKKTRSKNVTDCDRDRPVASVTWSAPTNLGEPAYSHIEPELQNSKFNILRNYDSATKSDCPSEPYVEKGDEHEFQNLFVSRVFSPRERQFTIGPTPNLPSLEPDIFDGNPINYCSFINSFDALAAYNVPEPKRKFYYLLQYTKGPARDLVKGCQYLPGQEGYIKTRNLLKNTFGQKFQIAKANIDLVANGPVLDIKVKIN